MVEKMLTGKYPTIQCITVWILLASVADFVTVLGPAVSAGVTRRTLPQ
jgi:hypothetical protein